jgi:hypothetical protein
MNLFCIFVVVVVVILDGDDKIISYLIVDCDFDGSVDFDNEVFGMLDNVVVAEFFSSELTTNVNV